MSSNTKPLENSVPVLNLFANNSSELDGHAFMESSSCHLHPRFSNSQQFMSPWGLPSLSIQAPTQSLDALNAYQGSSAHAYMEDWISAPVSSPCESTDRSALKNGCESMRLLNSSSNGWLDQKTNQPKVTQTFNYQMLPSSLENSIKEVSCLGSSDNHNKTIVAKNKNDDETARHQWSCGEDWLLVHLVVRHGEKNWTCIAEKLPGRSRKQCRERWQNSLRPTIKNTAWSEEEDKLLIELHKIFGNKWADIARRLPGRSENNVKNHWNSTKRRHSYSKARDKTQYPSLLKEYITSVTSSPSDDDINIHEKSTPVAPLELPERFDFDSFLA